MATDTVPTLDDIRQWPVTVDVVIAAAAFGIGRTHAYELVKRNEFPVRVIRIGRRLRVVTADLLALVETGQEFVQKTAPDGCRAGCAACPPINGT